MTGGDLGDLTLAPNHALRSAIEEHLEGLPAAGPLGGRGGAQKGTARGQGAAEDAPSGGDGGGGRGGERWGGGDDDDEVSVLDRAHARQLRGFDIGGDHHTGGDDGGGDSGAHGDVRVVEKWLGHKAGLDGRQSAR
jgi:hypothetical protein